MIWHLHSFQMARYTRQVLRRKYATYTNLKDTARHSSSIQPHYLYTAALVCKPVNDSVYCCTSICNESMSEHMLVYTTSVHTTALESGAIWRLRYVCHRPWMEPHRLPPLLQNTQRKVNHSKYSQLMLRDFR